ncbi:MAG: 3-phosphoserine/phosphohydroxythreonine transaminase [Planctomycetaceae bacterium]|nr:MAG: 3-phosphoserine/phosphohydroxythreonine transaminase [Planctomycetaceae bacterium]
MTTTISAVSQRKFNFSPGPAVLPVPVLEELRDELLCYPGAGCSLLEMSHRDKQFLEILHGAEASLRSLLGVGDDHAVLFLQGGARLQFSMIPANLLRGTGKTAEYLITGSWGKYALAEAIKEGSAKAIYDAKSTQHDRVPVAGDYQASSDAAYLYYCSNETIQGVQFPTEPDCPSGVPLVCDASSDFLCRPVDMSRYGLLYACAQKNAGPAGVTVVIIRRDLLPLGSADLPGYLQYRNHAENDSEWNTPPTFAIYALGKVANWLSRDIGGLAAMRRLNEQKAALLYDVVDAFPGFYQGHAQAACRSLMNVTFRLPSDDLQAAFLSEAKALDLNNLAGHRSVGGIRASIYNAMPIEGAETLSQFMTDFANRHAS